MRLGYSTGAVARGDFRLALERLRPFRLDAIELSALRYHELTPLVDAMKTLDLHEYEYVAIHAPGHFAAGQERTLVEAICEIAEKVDAVVVHPDAMFDPRLWIPLGQSLCFENMDKRKRIGRTADDLGAIFDRFPDARFCLDLGHAWQVDHTMTEARQILRRFRDRIKQVHASEVNTQSEHVGLTLTTVTAFRRVLDLLPDVPWILEAVTAPEKIGQEIQYARESFADTMELITD